MALIYSGVLDEPGLTEGNADLHNDRLSEELVRIDGRNQSS